MGLIVVAPASCPNGHCPAPNRVAPRPALRSLAETPCRIVRPLRNLTPGIRRTVGCLKGLLSGRADPPWRSRFPLPPAAAGPARSGGLCTYYEPVRFPICIHHRRVSPGLPMRPATPSAARGHRTSWLPRNVFPHVHGVSDCARPSAISRHQRRECCRTSSSAASAPRDPARSRRSLPQLNGWPARSAVNALPCPHQQRRMTRDCCGPLTSCRMSLSFAACCRFVPAQRRTR